MADLTVYAEALIAAVVRAFYEDDAVSLIDVLLRDKYLRDDDMGPRLSLPVKKVRATLQHLELEHLVKFELVDDLSTGGSQATKYWYIDFNHAVNVIRLRIYLLEKKQKEAEIRALSSSMYLCPGYKTKACNGRYTETEAQQLVHPETGLFLCQECLQTHCNNPEPPPMSTYTLELIDNKKDLTAAQNNMRRVRVQLGSKTVGAQQLRVGIYDLLQKVRQGSKGPLSSNLPSENISFGIGSTRLEGTGRTAGLKAKKLKEQGGFNKLEGASRSEEGSDLNFLKNARGEEVAFEVERGAGVKANLLARCRHKSCGSRKIMDAAATSMFARGIGSSAERERKRMRIEKQNDKKYVLPDHPEFLNNNIGNIRTAKVLSKIEKNDVEDESDEGDDHLEDGEDEDGEQLFQIGNGSSEIDGMSLAAREAAFHKQYMSEMKRQMGLIVTVGGSVKITGTVSNGQTKVLHVVSEDNVGTNDGEDESVGWEDG